MCSRLARRVSSRFGEERFWPSGEGSSGFLDKEEWRWREFCRRLEQPLRVTVNFLGNVVCLVCTDAWMVVAKGREQAEQKKAEGTRKWCQVLRNKERPWF